eukprot:437446_1
MFTVLLTTLQLLVTKCQQNISLPVSTSIRNEQCDHYSNKEYSMLMTQQVFNSIFIERNTIDVHFDVKLNNYCNKSVCSIFHLKSNYSNGDISLSINGLHDYFELSIMTDFNFADIHRAPSVKLLLPVDDKYHRFNLSHTFGLNGNAYSESHFAIDDTVYDYYSTYSSSILPDQKYQFYIANPFDTLNGVMSNICIKSSHTIKIVECGDLIQGALTSESHIEYYHFSTLSDLNYVLFDSCASYYDTYLYLWNITGHIVAEGDDDGNCGWFEQLVVQPLPKGEYILGISGYGSTGSHKYGEWLITVVCNNETNDTQDTEDHLCQSFEELKCGQIVEGALGLDEAWNAAFPFNQRRYIDYCFRLNSSSLVYFDSCGSGAHTELVLFTADLNSAVDGETAYCDFLHQQLRINNLDEGEYILRISAYENQQLRINYLDEGEYISFIGPNYHIHSICSLNIIDDEKYKVVSHDALHWMLAQIECEKQYGTTLATIITNQDLQEALEIADESFKNYAWIGLYEEPSNNTTWSWVQGESCFDEECLDMEPWFDEDNNKSIDSLTQIGTFLAINDVGNWTFAGEFRKESHVDTYPRGEISLCNAPNFGYKAHHCNDKWNCWNNLNIYNNSRVISDVAFNVDLSQPPFAYWNGKLFVIGVYEIHWTNIAISAGQQKWNHIVYDSTNSLDIYITSQQFAQYQSSLFIYAYEKGTGSDVLIHIDLERVDVTLYYVPDEMLTETYQLLGYEIFLRNERNKYCMVSGETSVYIIRPTSILTFEINAAVHVWNRIKFLDITPGACVITNDHKYIYLFGDNDEFEVVQDDSQKAFFIIKYNIVSGDVTYVDTANLCSPATQTRSIAAGNNKLYIHGCYPASWKTLVFDTTNEKFDTQTVDIAIPTVKDMFYYRKSHMLAFDDNVLLLIYMRDMQYPQLYLNPTTHNNSISLLYTITNAISINFTEIMRSHQSEIWPSDGFDIKYYLNDFTDTRNNTYFIILYSNDTVSDIHAALTLNTSIDKCVCNETFYNCHDCHQHFYLHPYLSVEDNNISQLNFIPKFGTNYNFDPLIRPKSIAIKLQRCNISFNDLNTTTTNIKPIIYFRFDLSENCYSRIGSNYSLNITAFEVNITKRLTISIFDNQTYCCKVCARSHINGECINCDDGTFEIEHTVSGLNETKQFRVNIVSNMIDFRVLKSNDIVRYIRKGENKHSIEKQLDNSLLYLFLLLIIPIVITLIVGCHCRRQYMSAFIVDKALVLIIGISQFDDKKWFLPGVKRNVDHLTKLWSDRYNYEVFCCNNETLYSNRQDVIDFIDKYKTKLENKVYECVIVHIISHGSDSGDSFQSSDKQKINVEDIRRELSDTFYQQEDCDDSKIDEHDSSLLLLIFNHTCRGDAIYFQDDNATTSRENDDINEKNIGNVIRGITSGHGRNEPTIYEDSNWAIIWGNVKGRALSDSGQFTECICDAFGSNLSKWWKTNFREVITGIGVNLEHKTQGAALCNINETLRETKIRLEPCSYTSKCEYEANVELQPLDLNAYKAETNCDVTEVDQLMLNDGATHNSTNSEQYVD